MHNEVIKRPEKVLPKYQIGKIKVVLAGHWSVHYMSRQGREADILNTNINKRGHEVDRCRPQQYQCSDVRFVL